MYTESGPHIKRVPCFADDSVANPKGFFSYFLQNKLYILEH